MANRDIKETCPLFRAESKVDISKLGTASIPDSESLRLGTSNDVTFTWDGTNLIIATIADDKLIEIGDSATTQLSFDLKWYANEASGASYLYADASANLIYTTGVDLQFKDNDYLVFGTGAGATGDVNITWDGTNLNILPTTDDTGTINFGNGTLDMDVKVFLNATTKYVLFDVGNSLLQLEDVDLKLGDNDAVQLGDGTDATLTFDGTSLALASAAASTPFLIGASSKVFNVTQHGSLTIGVNDTGYDFKVFGDTAGKYVEWSASADTLTVVGTLAVTGAATVSTTLGVTGDFSINTDKFAVAASTGVITLANGETIDNATDGTVQVTANVLKLAIDSLAYVTITQANAGGVTLASVSDGTAGFTFSQNVTLSGILQSGATATAALAIGGGTTATKLTTATADKNFLGFWTESTATSGDSRGLYLRHYLGGTIAATGYGDGIRAFTDVTGTGYSYASGIHATMQINTGATVTGSGAAVRATLAAVSATRTLVGSLAALQLDSDIGADNTLAADTAFIRLAKSGTVDLVNFLNITDDQCLKGSAATGAATNALPVIMPDGSTLYISLIAAS